jgi:hypothetical protein
LATKASEAQSREAHARADATFKKEERAREGAQAMKEYLATSKQVRDRMAELRALRLAKEAKDVEEAKDVKVAVEKTPTATSRKSSLRK